MTHDSVLVSVSRMVRHLIVWLLSWRSRSAPLDSAEAAFRAKYPTSALQDVLALGEDDQSYFVEVLFDSTACPMASFWGVSKGTFTARELKASEVNRLLES